MCPLEEDIAEFDRLMREATVLVVRGEGLPEGTETRRDLGSQKGGLRFCKGLHWRCILDASSYKTGAD